MARYRKSKILDAHGKPQIIASADYEGALQGRRMSTWGLSGSGPNTALYGSLNNLRARARELTRNDPQIDGGLDTLVSNLVGMGITPRWLLDDPERKRMIHDLWGEWIYESDAEGLLDFYGQQSLATRSVIEAGEVFIRFRPRYASDPLAVPLQLQMLESDMLDETYNTINPDNGNEIRMGIEFDRLGKRVAYHFFRDHPGESYISQSYQWGDRVRVPANQILHIFKPLRPGQQRGRPWLAPIIVLAHTINEYDDAETVRKKAAAMFGGFITKPTEEEDAPSPLGKDDDDDSEGNRVIALEPGTFPELPTGYGVEFSTPADVGGSYEVFCKRHDRRMARGFGGLTYEKFTGNLENVNYSSIRAGNLEFQRQCKQFIYNVLVFQMCRPVSKVFLNQAYLANRIDLPGFTKNRRKYHKVKWTIDGWPWVDPEKDLKAAKGMIRSGLSTRSIENAERGNNAEEIDAENAADNERADSLGLVYDSDGRKTDASGSDKGDGNNAETGGE